MKEKKIYAYEEARLVNTNPKKWYIHYKQTNPDTLEIERKRPTFEINTIKDLRKRKKEAEKWIRYVNSRLPLGYPFKNKESPKIAYEKLMDHISNFLGSVASLEHRNHVGEKLILEIKKQLPNVYQFINEDEPKRTPIFEALDFYERECYPNFADNTISNRKYFINHLRNYLTLNNLKALPVVHVSLKSK